MAPLAGSGLLRLVGPVTEVMSWRVRKGATNRAMFGEEAPGSSIEAFLPDFAPQAGVKVERETSGPLGRPAQGAHRHPSPFRGEVDWGSPRAASRAGPAPAPQRPRGIARGQVDRRRIEGVAGPCVSIERPPGSSKPL